MRIVNRTSYPTPEVEAIVRFAMTGRGRPRYLEAFQREQRTVLVLPQRCGGDRAGFTPFDTSLPIDLYLQPPSCYPQGPDAQDPYQDLFLSAAHEMYHDQHETQPCAQGQCEVSAEGFAKRVWRERTPR